MKTIRCLAITVLLAIVIAAPALAQDTGTQDTLRFVPASGTWTIDAATDSMFTMEIWGWSDQNVKGLSLPFILKTSTGGGFGHDDSLIVAKDWVPAITANIPAFSFSALDSATYDAALNDNYNGLLIGMVNLFAPLFPPSTATKFGEFTIRLPHPENASCDFDIAIDTLFFPPAGVVKFSPDAGSGYPPYFTAGTIHVVNNLCPAGEPTIGVDPSTFTFNAVEGGSNPATQALNISNLGDGDLIWSVSDDADWLSLDPTSGTNSGTVTLTVDITGLVANTYTGNITVTDPAATNNPVTVPVLLVVAAPPPMIVLDPTSFTFSATAGGSNPADQMLSISNGGGGTLNWTASDDADWLTINPASGSGDASVALQVDITGLSAGGYDATVTVSDPAASNDPQTATVHLDVAEAPPMIVLDPTSFTFSAVAGGSNPADQMLSISNGGGGTLNWTASDDADWLTVNPASGAGDASVALQVDITGLAAGGYDATVTVSDPAASNDPQTATVHLDVTEASPMIVLDPTSFTFSAVAGGSNPADQMLSISNGGGGTLNWTASDDADWLTVNPASGSGDASVALQVDITGLTPDTYNATVTISDPAASNDPQTATVQLIVNAAPPTIVLDPTSFTFNATAGGANPGDQSLSITNSGGGTLNWTATDDADWLTVNPASGTGDASVAVQVDITGLAAGTYNATITVSDPVASNDPQTASVELVVEEAPPMIVVDPTSLEFAGQAAKSNPPSQFLSITNGGGGTLDWSATNSEAWLSFTPASSTAPSSVEVSVDIGSLAPGVYNDIIVISSAGATNSPVEVPVMLTVTEAATLIVDPIALDFSATVNESNPPDQSISITSTDSPATELDWTASNIMSWLSLDMSSGTTPSTLTASVDITGMVVGDYIDTITVMKFMPPAKESGTGDTVKVVVALHIDNGNPEIDLSPAFFSYSWEVGSPDPASQALNITNAGNGILDWTLTTGGDGFLDPDAFSGTAPSVVNLGVITTGLTAGTYYDTVYVAGNAFNSPQFAIAELTVTEAPPTDEDTVWVGTASGTPGEHVVVPVIFKNIEELSGITLPLTYAGSMKSVNGLRCDSVSFIGSRVDYLSMKPVSIDTGAQTILAGAVVTSEDLIPVGTGPFGYLHFTIEPDAPAGVVPIDSTFIPPANELLFADGSGLPVYPRFVAGSVEIGTPPTPCLQISDDYFEFTATEGGSNPADQYLDISNCGEGTLEWTASTVYGTFLSLNPTSGTGDGTVTLSVDITGMTAGVYHDSIMVDAGDATNSPQYALVNLTIGSENIAGTVELPSTDPIPGATVELWDMYPSGSIVASVMSDGSGAFDFGPRTGEFDIRAYKNGYYPTVVHVMGPDPNVLVTLNPTGDVMPTNEWIDLYCDAATMDGYPIKPGDVLEAFDPTGVLCGQWFVVEDGTFGFMPVYRDEKVTTPDIDEGCDPGDEVTVKLNGFDISSFIYGGPIIWTENGDRFQACFDAMHVVEVCFDLKEGWNLISWNVDTESDDILDIIGDILPYVEVILGFEQGAGTYDPDLPEFSTLFTLDHYHGYWFYMNQDVEFCVSGLPVDPSTPINLEYGWNLASYLPTVTLPTQDALASIYSHLIIVLGFDGVGLTWDPTNPGASNLTEMSPKFGYWIKVDDDVTLTYPGGGPVAMYVSQPDNTSAKISTLPGVIPTTQWMDLYGSNVTVDGVPVKAGSTIQAVDEAGTLCGAYQVSSDGIFGFMPVYADDPSTSYVTEGPARSGKFHLVIDGVETDEEFTWTSSGDRVEVGALKSIGGTPIVPKTYTLHQNFPNPFNPSTSISYELGNSGDVRLTIYNLLGEEVKVLVDQYQPAGDYTIEWDGTDYNGKLVSSGVYFYKISSGDYNATKKMMLMK